MGHPLDGVRAKIDRAIEHLVPLNHAVSELRREPQPYVQIVHTNVERGEYRFELYPTWNPMLMLRCGVIVGEFVHDLRSALDHLVWQLVIANGNTPDMWHSFPLYGDGSKGFRERVTFAAKKAGARHGRLLGVSDDAIRWIEDRQPYKGSDRKLLATLDQLWQVDKHRHLTPMLLLTETPRVETRDAELLVPPQVRRGDDGTQVVYVSIRKTGPHPDVSVDAKAPYDIVFGEGAAAVDLIALSVFFVEQILGSSWDEFFPEPF